jgi:hypothetical protein
VSLLASSLSRLAPGRALTGYPPPTVTPVRALLSLFPGADVFVLVLVLAY